MHITFKNKWQSTVLTLGLLLFATCFAQARKQSVDYVNPFLGTTVLTNSADLGYVRSLANLERPGRTRRDRALCDGSGSSDHYLRQRQRL